MTLNSTGPGLLTPVERSLIARIIAEHRGVAVYARQLASATVADRQYSGVGVYVHLKIEGDVDRFPISINTIGTMYIRHPELKNGAFANLFVTQEGLLDFLDLVTVNEDWPRDASLFYIDSQAKVNILEENPLYERK